MFILSKKFEEKSDLDILMAFKDAGSTFVFQEDLRLLFPNHNIDDMDTLCSQGNECAQLVVLLEDVMGEYKAHFMEEMIEKGYLEKVATLGYNKETEETRYIMTYILTEHGAQYRDYLLDIKRQSEQKNLPPAPQ